jgi:putative membrane protein
VRVITSDSPQPAPPAGPPAGGRGDPDSRARTHLANERTFLAWFRTGLTLIALGIAAAQFLTRDVVAGIPVVSLLATILVVTGVALAVLGAWRHQRARRRIDAAAFEPAHWSIVLTTAAAVATGVLAIVFVWLLHA